VCATSSSLSLVLAIPQNLNELAELLFPQPPRVGDQAVGIDEEHRAASDLPALPEAVVLEVGLLLVDAAIVGWGESPEWRRRHAEHRAWHVVRIQPVANQHRFI